MKVALRSSVTSVLTRAARRNIPEDTILHSHRRENIKSDTDHTYLQLMNLKIACTRRGVSIRIGMGIHNYKRS
jgi:hypothetical protein